MGKPKTELWWVSVGGNPCEPARIVTENGREMVYTIGCGDPHERSDVECVEMVDGVDIPKTPKETARLEAAWNRKVSRDEKRGIFHHYRRFD